MLDFCDRATLNLLAITHSLIPSTGNTAPGDATMSPGGKIMMRKTLVIRRRIKLFV